MITKSKFSPRWWLRNPHLQTIYASLLSKRPTIRPLVERLELPDGDFLDICLGEKPSDKIVLITHGLAGSINSGYAKGIFAALEKRLIRPVFMHWRGCSGEPNRLARSYHSGATDDIHFLIEHLTSRFPEAKIMACGFSLGANALLKYLGEQGEHSKLQAAVAVCPPLQLDIGANKLNTGVAQIYQRYLLGPIRAQHNAKRKRYPQLELPYAGSELNSFWKFDNLLTAPLHGYDNAAHYYKQCSAKQYLNAISTRTHIIYALDDPFFTREVLTSTQELSSAVTVELSKHGGHVGFMADKSAANESWLDQRISDLLLHE